MMTKKQRTWDGDAVMDAVDGIEDVKWLRPSTSSSTIKEDWKWDEDDDEENEEMMVKNVGMMLKNKGMI